MFAARGPNTVASTTVVAITQGGNPRVFYQTDDAHIHELSLNPTWRDKDLTSDASVPAAMAAKKFTALAATTQGDNPRVYYQGEDGYIHELQWSNPSWLHNNVAKNVGAPPAFSGSDIVATSYGGSPRVYYEPTGGYSDRIHELAWNPNGWDHRDITGGGSPAVEGTTLAVVGGGNPRVYHLIQGIQGGFFIEELAWNPPIWGHSILHNQAIGATPAVKLTALATTTLGGKPRVYYESFTGHIHELSLNPDWKWRDVTKDANAIGATALWAPRAGLAATSLNDNPRVYYQGLDGEIHELAWNNPFWSHRTVSKDAKGPSGRMK
jgi:hypothetical protein